MWFSTFLLKNLRRRPVRSLLTIFAVSIAVGSVVALVGIASGFQRSFTRLYEDVGIDLLVVRSGNARRLTSQLNESLGDKIRQIDGVREVVPGLGEVVSFDEFDLFVVPVSGLVPGTVIFDHMKVTSGRKLKASDQREIMLGITLAETLGKKVGEQLDVVEGETFEIVGIFETLNGIEDGSIVMALAELQSLMDREGNVTGFSVLTDDSSNREQINRIKGEIEQLEKGIKARPTKEHVETLTEIQMAKGMAWITSAVAFIIGTVSMLNTMFMSVQERTREIGILRSIGWPRKRVVEMILGESLVLSFLGALTGTLAALVLVAVLSRLPFINGVIEFQVQPLVILQGFLVAIGLGFVGGLIPSSTAASLSPTTALRHE